MRIRSRRVGRALGLAAAGVLIVGFGAHGSSAKPRSDPVVEIDARDNEFDPERVSVRPGTRIRFVNVGRNDHNVIPTSRDQDVLRVPTRRLEPDESAVVRLTDPGRYRYYCSIHGTRKAGMIGSITVRR